MTSLETPQLSAEQATPDSRSLRLVRILLPIVVLAAGHRDLGSRGAA